MTVIARTHPRFTNLSIRAQLAAATQSGLVVPEGLIAQGRGEAFDYFLGEISTVSARRAERIAARWLLAARHPVVSVNGNVAALASPLVARMVAAHPRILVEVNLFHRTPGRPEKVAQMLTKAGVKNVLGVEPTSTIPGLPSDRAMVDSRGIALADVCLVPLEDGDRAEALQRMGKRIISIDLNPLSRTSQAADLPIIDELGRALAGIAKELERRPPVRAGRFPAFNASGALAAAITAMQRNLARSAASPKSAGPARVSSPLSRGTERRSSRTP